MFYIYVYRRRTKLFTATKQNNIYKEHNKVCVSIQKLAFYLHLSFAGHKQVLPIACLYPVIVFIIVSIVMSYFRLLLQSRSNY